MSLDDEDIAFGWAGCLRSARRLLEWKRTGVVPVAYPETKVVRVSSYSPEYGLHADVEL